MNYISINTYVQKIIKVLFAHQLICTHILPSSAPDANFFPSSPSSSSSSSSSLSSTGNTQYQIDISYKCCRLIDIVTIIIIIFSYLLRVS